MPEAPSWFSSKPVLPWQAICCSNHPMSQPGCPSHLVLLRQERSEKCSWSLSKCFSWQTREFVSDLRSVANRAWVPLASILTQYLTWMKCTCGVVVDMTKYVWSWAEPDCLRILPLISRILHCKGVQGRYWELSFQLDIIVDIAENTLFSTSVRKRRRKKRAIVECTERINVDTQLLSRVETLHCRGRFSWCM